MLSPASSRQLPPVTNFAQDLPWFLTACEVGCKAGSWSSPLEPPQGPFLAMSVTMSPA
jgi:hypothetical protein